MPLRLNAVANKDSVFTSSIELFTYTPWPHTYMETKKIISGKSGSIVVNAARFGSLDNDRGPFGSWVIRHR